VAREALPSTGGQQHGRGGRPADEALGAANETIEAAAGSRFRVDMSEDKISAYLRTAWRRSRTTRSAGSRSTSATASGTVKARCPSRAFKSGELGFEERSLLTSGGAIEVKVVE
jgi:hypothetical protein